MCAYEGFDGSLMVVLEGGTNKSRKSSSERSDFGNIQMKIILTLPFIELFCSFELAGHICVYVYIFDMHLFAVIPLYTPNFQVILQSHLSNYILKSNFASKGHSGCDLKMLKFGVRLKICAIGGQSTPIREGKINPIMGVYIPIKGGMTIPNREFRTLHISCFILCIFLQLRVCFTLWFHDFELYMRSMLFTKYYC